MDKISQWLYDGHDYQVFKLIFIIAIAQKQHLLPMPVTHGLICMLMLISNLAVAFVMKLKRGISSSCLVLIFGINILFVFRQKFINQFLLESLKILRASHLPGSCEGGFFSWLLSKIFFWISFFCDSFSWEISVTHAVVVIMHANIWI